MSKGFSFLIIVISLACFSCGKEDGAVLSSDYQTLDWNSDTASGLFSDLGSLVSLMKSPLNEGGEELQIEELLAILQNPEHGTFANGPGLWGMMRESDQIKVRIHLEELCRISAYRLLAASFGQAGYLYSGASDKVYLVDEQGVELATYLERWIAGATFYRLVTEDLLASNLALLNNDNPQAAGPLTEMEQCWDFAFSLFGVPLDFPDDKTSLRYWGDWCDDRNDELKANVPIMAAFIQGRAAISSQDDQLRTESVSAVCYHWDRICIANLAYQLVKADSNYDDVAKRCRKLSMAMGFLEALDYSPNSALAVEARLSIKQLLENQYAVSRSEIGNILGVLEELL